MAEGDAAEDTGKYLSGPTSNVALQAQQESTVAAAHSNAAVEQKAGGEEPVSPVKPKTKRVARAKQKDESEGVPDDAAAIRVKNRFNPYGTTKKTWDFILMFIIFYSVIIVPYRISFDVEATGAFAVIDIIFDIFFFADICVNFFTMYEDDQGGMEADMNKIAKEYLKGWFIIDIVSTFPFDMVGKLFAGNGGGSNLRAMKILRGLRLIKLVRLLRLLKLDVLIEMAADMLQVNSKYLMLGSLVFYQFFFAHLIACVWYSIAKVQKDPQTGQVIKNEDMPLCTDGPSPCITQGFSHYSWVYAQDIQDDSAVVRYMYSLYWTYATMTTVGYGDVSAANTAERKLSILLMVLGVTMFGYTLLMVALVLLDGDPRAMMRKVKMRGAEHFLSDRRVLGKKTSFRIKTHFQDLVAHQEDIFEERELLFFLHPSYRYRVMRDVSANNWPSKITFLKQFEAPLQSALFKCLKPCMCDRGDVMFAQGEIGFQLYFLYDGLVVLKRERGGGEGQAARSHKSIKIDNQGVFGEVSMVSSECRPYTATCAQLCHIAFMNKDEIYKIAEEWPQWLKALCVSSVYKMDLLCASTMEVIPQTMQIQASLRPIGHPKRRTAPNQVAPGGPVETTLSNYISLETEAEDDDMEADAIAVEAARMFNQHWLIHPRHPIKIFWDLVVGVFIMYSVVLVPYRLGFDLTPTTGAKFFDRIGDIFFFVDICLTFRTTFQDDNCQYVTSGGYIACDYLKSWFIIDFFSTVPIDIIAAEAGGGDPQKLRSLKILRVLRLFKLLKLLRLFKLKRLLGQNASKFEISPVFGDFLRHLFVLVFLTHLGACIWYGVAFQDRTPCGEGDKFEWPPPGADEIMYPTPAGRQLMTDANENDGMYVPKLRGLAEFDIDDAAPADNTAYGWVPPLRQLLRSTTRVAVGFATGGDIAHGRQLTWQRTFYEENGFFSGYPDVNRTWPQKRYYGGWFGRNMTEYESDYADRHDGVLCADGFPASGSNWIKGYSMGPSDAAFVLYDHLDNVNIQYISAMYWCFATFLSVGYGDVTATVGENIEIFVSIVGMSMGTICFAMFLSSVCMFVRLQMQKAEFKDMLARVKDYLRESALSKKLQKKVRSQFEMFCIGPEIVRRSPFYDEKQLVEAMPTLLGYEAAKKTYTDACMRIDFIRTLEDDYHGFLLLVSKWLFPMNLGSGECCYDRGSGHQYVFFIRKGSVEVVDANDDIIENLNAGKFFGEGMLAVPFGHVFRSRYNVYTTTHTLIYGLHRNFFRRVKFMSRDCGRKMYELLKPEQKVGNWFDVVEPS